MKLATLKYTGRNGKPTRDGKLVVVDRTLSRYIEVPEICGTMQEALDDWEATAPGLESAYHRLNAGEETEHASFHATDCMAPIPRCYQWIDGSAYVNHVELVRKARGADMPESYWHDPLMYQGGSDHLIGPHAPVEIISEDYGIDFEAEVAVITDDVPMHVSLEQAPRHIKLLCLVNDVSLRNLIPAELAKGFGFFHSKPASAFSPVAITPDELGPHWNGYKVHLPLVTTYNEVEFGRPNAGIDMTFNFAELISHAAKTRHLGAGTIIGSGTVSNRDVSVGSSCLAEKRMLEMIARGKPETGFMKFGDHIRIEMPGPNGDPLFGAISQFVVEHAICQEEVRYTSAFE
ncbi:fumarylacetoacetate hydrolase family protein [Kiloniella laminariae]|uniref:fumarylacetoacetate hydrolase family protein n=1 Tax=Kiloniella laminariae TaxID=454162 RepID=UPI00036B1E96|nr:fumarylacetoacetate hydrolase family protein [Kiloniella laminariae]